MKNIDFLTHLQEKLPLSSISIYSIVYPLGFLHLSPPTMPSHIFIIIFHIFDISNSIFFRLSIHPIFLIFSTFQISILPVFLIFSTFSILPIFLIFFISHFLFPISTFLPTLSLSHTNSFSSIPSIIPFLLSFHISTSLHFSQIPPHFTIFPNFLNRTVFCYFFPFKNVLYSAPSMVP